MLLNLESHFVGNVYIIRCKEPSLLILLNPWPYPVAGSVRLRNSA
jgi:hypothetical protein